MARALTAAVGLAVVAGGCNLYFVANLASQRRAAGVAGAVAYSTTLGTDAQAHAQAMCNGRGVIPSAAGAYQETAGSVHELVGSAPAGAQAESTIWAQWRTDPEVDAAQWTQQGAGEVSCSDGNVYATQVLKGAAPSLPTGRYYTPQYDNSAVQQFLGIQYTTAVDYTGTTIPLLLDVYAPPAGAPTPRPTIVLIHGGAFVGGSRSDEAGDALQWAARGYDAVSIDYRLDQSLSQDSSPPKELAAATNATSDAEQAARWIKANAATYGFDPARIAAVGNSAGGAVSLGMSAAPDFQPPSGDLAAYSSTIKAAVSTGAYLTPGIDYGVLHIGAGLAPILMFHYETDVASNTGVYAFRTCSAYRSAGSVCDYVSQAGEGHTTDLRPGGAWWASQLGPFIRLRLLG